MSCGDNGASEYAFPVSLNLYEVAQSATISLLGPMESLMKYFNPYFNNLAFALEFYIVIDNWI